MCVVWVVVETATWDGGACVCKLQLGLKRLSNPDTDVLRVIVTSVDWTVHFHYCIRVSSRLDRWVDSYSVISLRLFYTAKLMYHAEKIVLRLQSSKVELSLNKFECVKISTSESNKEAVELERPISFWVAYYE